MDISTSNQNEFLDKDKGIDYFLGSSSKRYLSSGFKRIEHSIENISIEEDCLFADLFINWPKDWSEKKGGQIKPHVGTLDYFLFSERLVEVYMKLVEHKKIYKKSIKDVANTFLSNGFKVTYMNFFRRSFSCKASRTNEAVISYNGDVFKCSGRDFTDELKEGFLNDNGKIDWQKEKLNKRLSIVTYDNSMCKECKYLPLCWGPCNQKQLENKSSNLNNYCQFKYLEMSEEDYILLRFNSTLIKLKENA